MHLLFDSFVGEEVHDALAVLPPDEVGVLLPLGQELGLRHKLPVVHPLG